MKENNPDNEYIRKRVERQKKRRKRRLKISFIVFILLVIIIALILSLTVFFPIKKININGSKIYTAEQIKNAAQIEENTNLFTISGKKIENKIRKKLPYIESITLKREIPDTLNISVKDSTEFAAYQIKSNYYIVSKTGWVMKKVLEEPKNVIIIKLKDIECNVGESIKYKDEKIRILADEILSCSKNEKISISKLDLTSLVDIKMIVDNRFEVILGTSNYIEGKIKHLRGMIENIPEEKSGEINLNMWNIDNTQATFKEKKEK